MFSLAFADEDSSFTWCREWECQESDSGDDNVNTSGNSEEIGENSGTIEIERYICSSDIPATSANGGKTCDNWAGNYHHTHMRISTFYNPSQYSRVFLKKNHSSAMAP